MLAGAEEQEEAVPSPRDRAGDGAIALGQQAARPQPEQIVTVL